MRQATARWTSTATWLWPSSVSNHRRRDKQELAPARRCLDDSREAGGWSAAGVGWPMRAQRFRWFARPSSACEAFEGIEPRISRVVESDTSWGVISRGWPERLESIPEGPAQPDENVPGWCIAAMPAGRACTPSQSIYSDIHACEGLNMGDAANVLHRKVGPGSSGARAPRHAHWIALVWW